MAKTSYAVIFTNQQTCNTEGYADMADRMVELAAQQPGFQAIESVRDNTGAAITVSYWDSLEAIRAWKRNAEHQVAQSEGRDRWYASYKLRVARVEYEYAFTSEEVPA